MALSGNFQSYEQGTNALGLYCEWTGVQNIEGNYTDIIINVYLHHHTISVGARSGNTCDIGDTFLNFDTSPISNLSTTTWLNTLLTTQTTRLTHGADGTRNDVPISITWNFNGTYSGVPITKITASAQISLDPISTYTLSLSPAEHSSIVINRTSSVIGDTGTIEDGATLYIGDCLKITASTEAGYSLASIIVNGNEFISGSTYTVDSDVLVETTVTQPYYKLTIKNDPYIDAFVQRLSSDIGTTGFISNNAKIYTGDIISVLFIPKTGYTATCYINDVEIKAGVAYTITGDTTISLFSETSIGIIKSDMGQVYVGQPLMFWVDNTSSEYTYSVRYESETLNGTIFEKVKEDMITLATWFVPDTFYDVMGTITTVPCKVICETYLNDVLIGSDELAIEILVSKDICVPEVHYRIIDNNPVTYGLTGDDTKLVRYMSEPTIEIVGIPQNGAYITRFEVNGVGIPSDGFYWDEYPESPARRITIRKTDPLYDGLFSQFTIKVTDSRGLVFQETITPEVIPYIRLTANPVLKRMTGTGNKVQLEISGDFFAESFGSKNNTITVGYQVRGEGEETYSDFKYFDSSVLTIENNSYTTTNPIILDEEYEYDKMYVFRIVAFDGGGTVTSDLTTEVRILTLNTGIPIFDWGRKDFNINVPLMLNRVNIFDLIFPVGMVYTSVTETLPEHISELGTWETIDLGLTGVYSWKRIE